MSKWLCVIAWLCLLPLLSGCEHKELCYQHPHVGHIRVVFDWRYAPDASPAGMCVLFYPVGGGEPVRYDFRGTDGGEVQLRSGNYLVMCYNNDTEAVLFGGTDNFFDYSFYTRTGNVLEPIYGNAANYAPRTDDERVVICPDQMWGAIATEVEVGDFGVRYLSHHDGGRATPIEVPITDEQVIVLYPHELTCTYTYEVRNVSNLKHVSQMCASLSGMSGRLTMCNEMLDAESVTLPFEAFSDGNSTIYGKFYTFGRSTDNPERNRLLLYIILDDGGKFLYGSDADRFDVTDQVLSAPDRRHVHLIVDGLDLPQPIENGHGFNPSVDDWQEVHEIIEM